MFASLEEIFCSIDNFYKYFDKNNQNYFLANSGKKRNKGIVKLSKLVFKRAMFLDFRQPEVFE
jgi:hypothetical protein